MPVFHPDHRADAMRARRIATKDKRIFLEAKWKFAPTEEKHVVPRTRTPTSRPSWRAAATS